MESFEKARAAIARKVEEAWHEWKVYPSGCRARLASVAIRAVAVLFFVGIVGFIVALIVCSIPRLDAGRVVDKSYSAAYTSMNSYTTTDGKGAVSVHMTPMHHPESWGIEVTGYEKDGTPRTEWWSVGAGLYGMIEAGDTVRRENGAVYVDKGAQP